MFEGMMKWKRNSRLERGNVNGVGMRMEEQVPKAYKTRVAPHGSLPKSP